MSHDTQIGRREPFRAVLGFTFKHWARQPGQVAWVAGVTIVATLAELFTPVYAGRLVDAVSGTVGAGARKQRSGRSVR